ncbi:MAG: anti-sigma factor [Stygiobacter sp. RIFOXYC12_FULL_38_8]|nr:MAG: anti-sigma factor [Stygiobacter sp. GWC2_38_9]OGU77681.1 MAG: anti-sigma factor [Stygiobacter sp. RIFOXYA12_FULL_38_9]OGV09600.1 MAG: anti-sigma factor [Stygiobacter sp. RIFOXYB2_FULL_37_11]OGV16730.1 MAG: anti-sigma factor [Stygiobacter sp. RIFOXYC2_FULL_38_25]OGV18160.1 MAG: anti-sigma factor [Stygiobacter sp. RIFOXYA2_FULL_38_8]OGV24864.1 MAG: anti-sigma factor [Stygiobacter sp. RIFOXYC12_FULL_38_8]OGV82919.1 MAG: anti-sigma factor [Stygiobacter sp. GWF2_38_21]RJQ62974.1 MAG: cupi
MLLQIAQSTQMAWKPLVEEGVKTEGISIKVLQTDEATKRAPTILLKFEAGASYPNHNHPGGEEAFVLEGEVRFGPTQLNTGDYLYTPPGGKHSVFSKTGCVILLIVPEEVEIL